MPDGRKHLENDCLMSGTPSNPAESVPLPSHALPTSTGETGDALDFSIVGIGASAGGLDACRKFADALPAGNGMAFILVQHLDPTHESMMVDLLADNTPMTVVQAVDGMPVGRITSMSFRLERISRWQAEPCVFQNRWRGTVRACLSISCCIRWRRNAASGPSA